MRSGYIYLYGGIIRDAAQVGYDWASRSYTDTIRSYYLGFDTIINVSGSGNGGRFYGFPLRCLSTVLDM